jgi:ParB family chromosome partitioning protein
MSNKRNVLGRGLSALIPEAPTPRGSDQFFMCPIEQIRPQRNQPRRFVDEEGIARLAISLKQQGLVQPLVVRPTQDGQYVLIAGERRWRAAQKAAISEVPVVIREVSDQQAFEMALVENLQREDLNPIEEAEAYARLIDEHGYTQEALAAQIGKDRSTIANALRLLKLADPVRDALIAGEVSSGHARALLALGAEADVPRVLEKVVSKALSVRQTEQLIRRMLDRGEPRKTSVPEPDANTRDVQDRLSRSLGTRVLLRGSASKGHIEVHYGSLDELERLLDALLK